MFKRSGRDVQQKMKELRHTIKERFDPRGDLLSGQTKTGMKKIPLLTRCDNAGVREFHMRPSFDPLHTYNPSFQRSGCVVVESSKLQKQIRSRTSGLLRLT